MIKDKTKSVSDRFWLPFVVAGLPNSPLGLYNSESNSGIHLRSLNCPPPSSLPIRVVNPPTGRPVLSPPRKHLGLHVRVLEHGHPGVRGVVVQPLLLLLEIHKSAGKSDFLGGGWRGC